MPPRAESGRHRQPAALRPARTPPFTRAVGPEAKIPLMACWHEAMPSRTDPLLGTGSIHSWCRLERVRTWSFRLAPICLIDQGLPGGSHFCPSSLDLALWRLCARKAYSSLGKGFKEGGFQHNPRGREILARHILARLCLSPSCCMMPQAARVLSPIETR
jgi:hypothetical protein